LPNHNGAVLYLASTSPRRQQLLEAAGVPYRLHAPGPEGAATGMPVEQARARARSKATGVAGRPAGPGSLLAVDTVVALGDVALHKPRERADAEAMIRRLSGQTHAVHTAHCLLDLASGAVAEVVTTSLVRCRPLTDGDIASYLDTGEWQDKAGAYGIQGAAGDFMELAAGDLDTVIGLSVAAVLDLLAADRRGEAS
jgi:nucleoside triphosphate pyrophosphatase